MVRGILLAAREVISCLLTVLTIFLWDMFMEIRVGQYDSIRLSHASNSGVLSVHALAALVPKIQALLRFLSLSRRC